VEDFGLRITGLANQLCVLGDDITDKEVVKKGSSSGGGNSGGHGDHGYGRGRGRGHSGGCNGGARSSWREDTTAHGACHNCGKVGHFAREGRSKKKNGEAHAAHEEEASLLLATGGAVQTLPPPPPPPVALLQILAKSGALSRPCIEDGLTESRSIECGQSVGETVHLVEEKVFAQLGDVENKDCCWWVLDTGAMNHMTGYRSAISDLDHNIHDTVRFGGWLGGADRRVGYNPIQQQVWGAPSVH
jgi:hypothetical protein